MRKEQAHGTSSTANAREPGYKTVQVLHTWELTTTTALVFGLMCSWPVSAAELELKPTFDNPGIQVASITFLPDWMGVESKSIPPAPTPDTSWCEQNGFKYYSSGKCPEYNKQTTCSRDRKYLKCDPLQWCKDNGYNTTSCSIPNYLDTICPNGLAQYKGCKEDTPRACKELGYKNSCSSGQKLHATNGRCSYNNSYGTCCTPSGCPANTSLSGSYGSAGSSDGCGYACYYTCNMNCPSGTSTSNPGGCGGSTTNGCGTKTCYYPYEACCTPYSSETSCSCGSYSCSDGCGGTRTCCKSCPPPTPSPNGTIIDECGGCPLWPGGNGNQYKCYHDAYVHCYNGRVIFYQSVSDSYPCAPYAHGDDYFSGCS